MAFTGFWDFLEDSSVYRLAGIAEGILIGSFPIFELFKNSIA